MAADIEREIIVRALPPDKQQEAIRFLGILATGPGSEAPAGERRPCGKSLKR